MPKNWFNKSPQAFSRHFVYRPSLSRTTFPKYRFRKLRFFVFGKKNENYLGGNFETCKSLNTYPQSQQTSIARFEAVPKES